MSQIEYNKKVGIFSQDGKVRLDIGTDAVQKQVSADRDSWATRLRIQDVDPIVDFEILFTNQEYVCLGK